MVLVLLCGLVIAIKRFERSRIMKASVIGNQFNLHIEISSLISQPLKNSYIFIENFKRLH